MAENLHINKTASKIDQYKELLTQIDALTFGEKNTIANLSNITAALKQTFNFFWVGFYLVDEESNELVLGPFQGPIACTRIRPGKGVCGTSWEEKKVIIVPNVDEFPGHIACSSDSKSEIVLPILKNNVVKMILDIDSDVLNDFNNEDEQGLTLLAQFIEENIL